MLALTSCVAPDKVTQTLEAKAKGGDAVAACQLVVYDLRQCAATFKTWINSGARKIRMRQYLPNCLADPVSEAHERYLAEAVGWVEGAPAPTLGQQVARSTRVLEVVMDNVMPDDTLETLNAIEGSCPRLAGEAL